jgi:hypothetical protein
MLIPKEFFAIVISVALFAGAAADRVSVLPPRDSEPYHARVRAAAEKAPTQFGTWTGVDCKVPGEATKLLRPNAVVSRVFTDSATGMQASFLLVQCTDVRDMLFHYPPICYPARGLTQIGKDPRQWNVDGLKIAGTEYSFESSTFANANITIVDNFMILPDGRTAPNMEAVREQLRLRNRYFGAAQIQVVFDGGFPRERRDAVCAEFIANHMPLINVIRSGASQ